MNICCSVTWYIKTMNRDTTLLQVSARGAGCLLWYRYPHEGEIFLKCRTKTVDSHPAFLYLEILMSVHDGAVTSVLVLTFH
jgi:hypothetical protein